MHTAMRPLALLMGLFFLVGCASSGVEKKVSTAASEDMLKLARYHPALHTCDSSQALGTLADPWGAGPRMRTRR